MSNEKYTLDSLINEKVNKEISTAEYAILEQIENSLVNYYKTCRDVKEFYKQLSELISGLKMNTSLKLRDRW